MLKLEKLLLAGAIILTVIGISLLVSNSRADVNLGNAESAFTYKTLTSSNASTTAEIDVRGGAGVLGNIVISTPSATTLSVYDGTATSTGALIATFSASAPRGTYEFNSAVKSGIVVQGVAGFDGVFTINYK